MQRGNYRNVPVVNDEGKPLGVLDVLALLDGALLIGHENSGDNGAEGDQQVAIKVVWGKTTLLVQETDKFIEKVYAGLIASETRGLVPDMKDMVRPPPVDEDTASDPQCPSFALFLPRCLHSMLNSFPLLSALSCVLFPSRKV